MARGNLKSAVRAAITSNWRNFEQAHPRLAAVVDEELLVAQAVERLSDDADYQETMADAVAMGNAASTMTDYVGKFIRKWLKSLV